MLALPHRFGTFVAGRDMLRRDPDELTELMLRLESILGSHAALFLAISSASWASCSVSSRRSILFHWTACTRGGGGVIQTPDKKEEKTGTFLG